MHLENYFAQIIFVGFMNLYSYRKHPPHIQIKSIFSDQLNDCIVLYLSTVVYFTGRYCIVIVLV